MIELGLFIFSVRVKCVFLHRLFVVPISISERFNSISNLIGRKGKRKGLSQGFLKWIQ